MNREQIVQEALALPLEDRTYVADRLEQSLAHGDFGSPEIAAAWSAEIDRRIAAYDQGKTVAVDAKLATERILARAEEQHRSRTAGQ